MTKENSLLAALLVIALGGALFAFLHNRPKLNEAEIAAKVILEKNAQARGGLVAWRAARSMTLTGLMDAGRPRSAEMVRSILEAQKGNKVVARNAALHKPSDTAEETKSIQLPFSMDLQRPRKMRLEIQFQGQTALQVYDGEQGWKLRPFLGRHEVENFTQEELSLASEQQDLDGPLLDYDRKGSRVELEGADPVEGRDAFKLKVTLQNGHVRHVWVDQETYLDVKIDGTRRMDGKPRAMFTYFRDYKSVDGLMLPFTMETTVEGVKGSEKIVVEKLTLNSNLDDSRFSKPE